METKVRKYVQIKKGGHAFTRFETSVPKTVVESIDLEGTRIEWKIISKNEMVLKVKRDNGHGRKSGSGT